MKDHIKPHLTVVDKTLHELHVNTPPGMAFWAGTGPRTKTCRECTFYEFNGYKSKKGGISGGVLKVGICNKYLSMMKVAGGKVPFETLACKYFDLNAKAPPITDPRKN